MEGIGDLQQKLFVGFQLAGCVLDLDTEIIEAGLRLGGARFHLRCIGTEARYLDANVLERLDSVAGALGDIGTRFLQGAADLAGALHGLVSRLDDLLLKAAHRRVELFLADVRLAGRKHEFLIGVDLKPGCLCRFLGTLGRLCSAFCQEEETGADCIGGHLEQAQSDHGAFSHGFDVTDEQAEIVPKTAKRNAFGCSLDLVDCGFAGRAKVLQLRRHFLAAEQADQNGNRVAFGHFYSPQRLLAFSVALFQMSSLLLRRW
ncbi:hypothetical protein [Mesorhizobium sp. URHB0026]